MKIQNIINEKRSKGGGERIELNLQYKKKWTKTIKRFVRDVKQLLFIKIDIAKKKNKNKKGLASIMNRVWTLADRSSDYKITTGIIYFISLIVDGLVPRNFNSKF